MRLIIDFVLLSTVGLCLVKEVIGPLTEIVGFGLLTVVDVLTCTIGLGLRLIIDFVLLSTVGLFLVKEGIGPLTEIVGFRLLTVVGILTCTKGFRRLVLAGCEIVDMRVFVVVVEVKDRVDVTIWLMSFGVLDDTRSVVSVSSLLVMTVVTESCLLI